MLNNCKCFEDNKESNFRQNLITFKFNVTGFCLLKYGVNVSFSYFWYFTGFARA